ncbi:GumC domain-containing protein [Flammeovirga kamogawensis]|uniref:Polysaccharide chain length determinant N-terminal domain-containing protein n=1 Tax=Flammeovirga kamogawensis TaxID=373891 RepID=A0ABX8H299_9BACT|nr:hypothetical protein [Flammeovirga kamogawensis]MBB6460218.1 uncharacterized protein involved in exopolysaccharide biosynthesis [Flammeovirga kamogawensis]QWG10030.1 hypothetical protein KM029_20320 [Flammeovirga kamogawensis]TRX65538.1 hypothetical protein EO216_23750 [Flammeovirga kamogawensis]
MENLFYIIKGVLKRWYLWLGIPFLTSLILYLNMKEFKIYESKAKMQFELTTDGSLSITSKSLQLFEIGLMFTDLLEIARIKRVTEQVQLEILIECLGENKFYNINSANNLFSDEEIIRRAKFLIESYSALDMQRPIDITINNILIYNNLSTSDINNRIIINRIGSSKYIDVKVEDSNPIAAKFIVKSISNAWIREYRHEIQKRYSEKRKSIEATCNSTQKELNILLDSLKEYKRKKKVIDVDETTKYLIDRRIELQNSVAKLKKDLASKKESIAYIEQKLNKNKDFGFSDQNESINSKIIVLKDSLRKLQQEKEYNSYNLERLPTDYMDKLNIKIAGVEKSIQKSISSSISSTTYDPSLTKQTMVNDYVKDQIDYVKEEAMIKVMNQELYQLSKQSDHFIEIISNIKKMEHQIKTKEKYYLTLLEKKYFAEILEDDAGHNFFIVETANFPIKHKKSKRALIVLGSFIGSLILFIVVITSTIIFDPKYHLPFQFEKDSLIPIISTITLPITDKKNSKYIPSFLKKIFDRRRERKNTQINQITIDNYRLLRRTILSIEEDTNIISFIDARSNFITLNTILIIRKMLQQTGIKTLLFYADWNAPLSMQEINESYKNLDDLDTLNECSIINLSEEQKSPYDYLLPEDWFSKLKNLRSTYNYIFIIPPPTRVSTEWMEWINLSSEAFYVFELHQSFNQLDVKNQTYLLDTHCNIIGGILTSKSK